jgi:extracellular matrix protein 14
MLQWISTTTVNYLAWALITSYGKDPLITKFLNNFDVVFIPELNPDGIEYTWSADRLWRKSRQHTSMQYCRGLDLDHAFGYQWDGSGLHENDPCSESVRPQNFSFPCYRFHSQAKGVASSSRPQ